MGSQMNRREFLRLGVRDDRRVAELSCEALFMQVADAGCATASPGAARGRLQEAEWWSAEPPLEREAQDLDGLLESVAAAISGAQVVRVSGREWLPSFALGQRLQGLLDGFARRGGQVEYLEVLPTEGETECRG